MERISVNPQTMQDKTLQSIGRHHTVEQTKEVFALARECGFENINMDLIIGLPGETPEDFENTLEQIRKLDPDSITIHSLVVKRASRLRRLLDEGAVPEEERARRHGKNDGDGINLCCGEWISALLYVPSENTDRICRQLRSGEYWLCTRRKRMSL